MDYKIMIVEDDMNITKLLSSYIEKYGYEANIVKEFDLLENKILELSTKSC